MKNSGIIKPCFNISEDNNMMIKKIEEKLLLVNDNSIDKKLQITFVRPDKG